MSCSGWRHVPSTSGWLKLTTQSTLCKATRACNHHQTLSVRQNRLQLPCCLTSTERARENTLLFNLNPSLALYSLAGFTTINTAVHRGRQKASGPVMTASVPGWVQSTPFPYSKRARGSTLNFQAPRTISQLHGFPILL